MKKTIWTIIVIIVIIVIAFVSIHKTQAPTNTAPAPTDVTSIPNGTFALSTINGSSTPSGANYTVSFTDGQIQAQFCNSMKGPYTLTDGTVTAHLAATLKFCVAPAGVMDAESVFGKVLASGAHVSLANGMLTLSNASTTLMFMPVTAQ